MSILVFVEHRGEDLERGSLGVLSKAAALGAGEVGAVLAGGGSLESLVPAVGRFGADRVYLAEDSALNQPLPQPRVDVLAQVVATGGHDTVLLSNTVLSADVAAGLAARLDAGLNWDLIDIEWRDGAPIGKRPALQDSVLIDVAWRSPQRLALFRAGSFEAVPGDRADPQVEKVPVRFEDHSRAARIVSQQAAPEAEGLAMEDADVIVTGGMGLGGPENFALAEELATVLGGAVGATRAAVYAGWYPRSAQIGQTGRTVSPKLYLALGVSGAVQHKVGMQGSKAIVAINKDAGAPIFELSDLAVIGDVHTIVPRLIELIRQRKGA
jgi:electron transfer flavoprotein alpha subunit